MRPKFLKLVLGFTFILFFISPFVVRSGGGGGKSVGGGSKNPQSVCPVLTNINFTINGLSFFGYANYTAANFNHTNSIGTNNISDPSKYFCKITIEPMLETYCFNPATYTFYWVQPSNTLVIQRPSGVVCKLTIEYYDNCQQWDFESTRSRRYWKYSTTIGANDTFANGAMQLVTKIYGC